MAERQDDGYGEDYIDPLEWMRNNPTEFGTNVAGNVSRNTPTQNQGSPGSMTAQINSAWQKEGDPWVEAGDTGGYLGSKGITIKPGSSMTESERQNYLSGAGASGISNDWITNFLRGNNDDESRLLSAYESELRGGSERDGDNRPGGGDWITSYLQGMMGGKTGMGGLVQQNIEGLLKSGGNFNQDLVNKRWESAREGLDKSRNAQLSQAKAALADRGLLSLPGMPSGAEAGMMSNIEDLLAPVYAGTMRDIQSDEMQNAADRYMSALGLGETSGQHEFENMLNTLLAGNTRDETLANISLGTLDRNIQWQSLLAQLGMQQQQLGSTLNVDDLSALFA